MKLAGCPTAGGVRGACFPWPQCKPPRLFLENLWHEWRPGLPWRAGGVPIPPIPPFGWTPPPPGQPLLSTLSGPPTDRNCRSTAFPPAGNCFAASHANQPWGLPHPPPPPSDMQSILALKVCVRQVCIHQLHPSLLPTPLWRSVPLSGCSPVTLGGWRCHTGYVCTCLHTFA